LLTSCAACSLFAHSLQIVGYMVILYTLIGWPAFAGLVLMVAAGPVMGVIMQKLYGLNRQMVKYTDQRIKTTNEALQGIQAVKMYTWEESFEKNIEKDRNEELSFLARVANLRGFSRAYMTALPGVVAVVSFIVFAVATVNPSITASTLFAALVAFDQLRFPLLLYPMAFAQLAQARVSAGRVEAFLKMKEIGKGEITGNGKYSREDDGHGEIVVKDATIFWNDPALPIGEISSDDAGKSAAFTVASSTHGTKQDSDHASTIADSETPAVKYSKPILENVTFDVAPGELCAVVGRVASGKSTLCSAILNETILDQGEIVLKGRIAYAAQSPWILNASLRDNILFGMPMDEEKYERVIHACQLTYDLEMLEDGDLTQIGERGITLSGGQKARVSVARAAYSNADTIILGKWTTSIEQQPNPNPSD
jgi:ATP-binding cassette subfamily C (CFTR/MRP) protein 1